MARGFDDWESGPYLEHHGIPGMKWGIRKYQNKDGSLTGAGKSRYGANSGEITKARKMQRDLNNLDQGRADLLAYRRRENSKLLKREAKASKYAAKKGLVTKGAMAADKKMNRLNSRVAKSSAKIALNDKQRQGIEKLQRQILEKSRKQGYTSSSKNVVRYGNTRAQKAAPAVGYTVGGLIGAGVGSVIRDSRRVTVQGKKYKIRSKYR